MATNVRTGLNWPPFMSSARKHVTNPALMRWGIVLAGGEGVRMRPLIRSWIGRDCPKQYCTFVGSRSMFQHTISRVHSVVPQEHVVTIIGHGHRKFLSESANEQEPGLILEQPINLGTAPGVFLPIAYVLADNPEATVVLLPSDHFVHPEELFCDHIIHTFEVAEKYCDQLILSAAIPNSAETEYGWIAPDSVWTDGSNAPTDGPMKVMRFQEKPDEKEAHTLLREGCLWNTMVITVNAKTLWALGQQCLPEMMYIFDAFLMVLRAIRKGQIDPNYEASALASIYNELSPADFSRDVLQHVSDRSLVLRMDGVDWCDWGHPQRVTETLAGLGLRPFFPSECIGNILETASVANDAFNEGIT